MRQRATLHDHIRARGCYMHGGPWFPHSCLHLGTVPTNGMESLACRAYFWHFSIAHTAGYQPDTVGPLNLAWFMIQVMDRMEGRPVSC